MNKEQTSPVTRRDFLKTTGAVVGATAVSALSIERAAFAAAGNDELKIALIGCGGRGSGAAAQALKTGNTKLVAMADAFRERLDSSLGNLKSQAGIPNQIAVTPDTSFIGLDAYKKAIELADVVILATPPGFRPLQFEEAIRQGKHVFMEKPVATDGPGVRRVLAAAEEAKRKNLKVGVGLQRHHQDGYIETMKRLHDGAIGDIVSMRAYWNDGGVWVRPRRPGQTEMEYQVMNWYYFTWLSGDHICEQHIHNLDVINWVKNAYPVRCQGMGGRQVRTGKEYGEIYDHHAVEFEYGDGSRMFSQCRHIRGCWSSVSEHAQGTKGACDISGHRITGPNEWRYQNRQRRDAYQEEHHALFDAIRNNKDFNEAFNGAKSSLTSIMGRMATYSGKVIQWEEALNSEIDLLPEKLTWDGTPKVLPDANGFYPIPTPGVTIVT